MKYIYKHGNQYWYQRAIPSQLSGIVGKKTLKVSLKTNKISTALKRATLQALEHKKMFNELKAGSTQYIKKIFRKRNFDIDKYTIKFNDDYDDLVNKLLLNKSELISLFNKISENKIKNNSLEKVLSDNFSQYPLLSIAYEDYEKEIRNKNDFNKMKNLKKSISILIKICGNKSIDDYSEHDSIIFKNFFIRKESISTGKKHQSNIKNFLNFIFRKYSLEKTNYFIRIIWPKNRTINIKEIFNIEELNNIKLFCSQENNLTSLIIGLIFDTGCSFNEIIGLMYEDINLGEYSPYIIIRSNEFRKIKNIYRKRIIPLVGFSLESIKKIKLDKKESLLFEKYLKNGFKKLYLVENKVNKKIKELTNGKTCVSFRYTLIERLKQVGCPEKIITEILGLANKELFYKDDINLEMKQSWLDQVKIL